jgi:hypothetical protein
MTDGAKVLDATLRETKTHEALTSLADAAVNS